VRAALTGRQTRFRARGNANFITHFNTFVFGISKIVFTFAALIVFPFIVALVGARF
jgi:hypothetical protein